MSQGIFSDFPGYQTATDADVEAWLSSAVIVLDTNLLLGLYAFDQPARDAAVKFLDSVKDRVFIPHQVMREFWRNRSRRLWESRPKPLPLEALQQQLAQVLNALNPDRSRLEAVEELKTTLTEQIAEIGALVTAARGTPIDVERALANTRDDPVLVALEPLLEGRVGAAPTLEEESEAIAEGLRRFALRIPPGYEDADKSLQHEQGTGDYLIWRQVLRHASNLEASAIILVTGDSKEDWRAKHPSGSSMLGVRPELVAESLAEANKPLALLLPAEFYGLVGRAMKFDETQTQDLVAASDTTDGADASGGWSRIAYSRLLRMLEDEGFSDQAAVLVAAARGGGAVSRAEIYEICNFGPDRPLTKFASPTHRLAGYLVDRGVLEAGVELPLEAMYNGPGKAVGYRVPPEFVEFQERMDSGSGRTWLEDAISIMEQDSARQWTPEELVDEIVAQDLRDVTRARTPVKTLRRDLALRGRNLVRKVGDSYSLADASKEEPSS